MKDWYHVYLFRTRTKDVYLTNGLSINYLLLQASLILICIGNQFICVFENSSSIKQKIEICTIVLVAHFLMIVDYICTSGFFYFIWLRWPPKDIGITIVFRLPANLFGKKKGRGTTRVGMLELAADQGKTMSAMPVTMKNGANKKLRSVRNTTITPHRLGSKKE